MNILMARAQQQIDAVFPDMGIHDLHLVGRGPVFTVLKGTAENDRNMGVRIAPEHWIESDDRHPVSAHDLLTQECLISTHCRAHGLPAPEIIGQSDRSHHDDGLDLFIYEWLDDDGNPPEPFHMGEMLHRLHSQNPPAFVPVAMQDGSLEKALSRRILRGANTITRLTNRPLNLPDENNLLSHLSWPDRRTSLLHMDFQPANLHAKKGHISGVTGWCEALIGPPTLELVRLDELDVLDDSFLGGYANYEMFKAPRAVETAFRLDTATRHAETLLHNAPGTTNAQKAVNRAAFLFEEFAQQSAA